MKCTPALLFLLLFSFGVFAQKPDSTTTINPDSLQNLGDNIHNSPYGTVRDMTRLVAPNVASFERNGNLPIDYFTGRINYSIPLLNIALNHELNIPMELAYDNSGLKPEDIPSWTGNGWMLNVGGVITQYVKGVNDITSASGLSAPSVRNDLDRYHAGGMTPAEERQYFLDALSQSYDTQFDVFSYSFMGHSGKFYFDRDTVKFFKADHLKVVLTSGGNFEVTDDKGYKYVFGVNTVSSGNYEEDYGGALNFNEGTKTWYLTAIVTPWNEQLTITYTQDIGYTVFENGVFLYSGYKVNAANTACENEPAYRPGYTAGSRTITQMIPSTLTYPGGSVVFETIGRNDLVDPLGNKSKALQAIKHFNVNGSLIKYWRFGYSYMGGSTANDRLQLDSLSAMEGTVTKDTWRFEYYSGEIVPIPDLLTPSGKNPSNHALDYWRFYNGESGNINKIPRFDYSDINSFNPSTTQVGGANRFPKANYSQIGMLQKVTYPDKGYTLLEYEGNSYLYTFPYNQLSKYLRTPTPEVSYTPVYTSPTATCEDISLSGEFTLSEVISSAQIYLNMHSNSPGDMNRVIIRKKDDQSVILDEFRSVDVYWIDFRYLYLAAGVYEYELIPACNNPNWDPVSSVMFGISKPAASSFKVGVGGNRIKRITDYPVAGFPVVRTLEYNSSELNLLVDFDFNRSVASPMFAGGGCTSCGSEFVLSEQNRYSFEGPHLQNLKVTEYHNLNGKTEYNYHRSAHIGYMPVFTNRYSRPSLPWRDANLHYKNTYNKDDINQLTTRLEYAPLSVTPFENRSLVVAFKFFCTNVQNMDPLYRDRVFATGIDPLFTDKFGVTQEIITQNADLGGITLSDTTFTDYNTRWQPYRIQKSSSDGGRTAQTSYYAEDFNNSAGANIASLKSKHITGKPLKVLNSVNGVTAGGYMAQSDANGNPVQLYGYESGISHVHSPATLLSPDFSLDESRVYNTKGRISGFTSRDGVPYTYLWSYNFTHPVALIANASETQVSAVIGSLDTFGALTSEASIAAGLSSLRSSLTQSHITTALYSPGIGIKQLTSADGMLFYYEYDGMNRLKTVKDRNGKEVDLYTYQNALTLITE